MKKTLARTLFIGGGLVRVAEAKADDAAAAMIGNETVSRVFATPQAAMVEAGDTLHNIVNLIIEFVVKYSFQALGGIIVLAVAWLAAKYVCRFVGGVLQKHNVDVTVAKFIVGAVKLTIMAFAAIVALSKFGFEIAPLIAGISVVGFGTSFALQGPLSNYASGITLIFTKPFKVGDIIEVVGVTGEVTDMQLGRTELKTVDGEVIVVPNKHIVGEIIHNFSDFKRLDIKVGVSYKTDIAKAIEIVKNVIMNESRIINGKAPKVGIFEFADSSVTIYARVWCKQDNYWDALFAVNKNIFDEFNRSGIEIPFPQRDVHIYKET